MATLCGRLGIFLDVFDNGGVVVVLRKDVSGEEGVEGVEASHIDAWMWIWRSGGVVEGTRSNNNVREKVGVWWRVKEKREVSQGFAE